MSYGEYMQRYRALLATLQEAESVRGHYLNGDDLRLVRECVASFVNDADHDRSRVILGLFEQLFSRRAGRVLFSGDSARELATATWKQCEEAWEAKPPGI